MRSPQGLVIDPASGKLFVQNFMSRTITVVDVNFMLDGIGGIWEHLTDVAATATEPLTAQVLLGKQIFYDSESLKINQDGYMSCANCHSDGGNDGAVIYVKLPGVKRRVCAHKRVGPALYSGVSLFRYSGMPGGGWRPASRAMLFEK